MTTTVELLNRLFKPVQVLLVDTNEELERMLNRICACTIEHYTGAPPKKVYDVVFADSEASEATLDRIKDCGPLILIGSYFGRVDYPVVLLPKIDEHALERVFTCLKVKLRTPDVVEAISELTACSASDALCSAPRCVMRAA